MQFFQFCAVIQASDRNWMMIKIISLTMKGFFQILHKIILLLFFSSHLVTTQQNCEHSNVRTISVNWDFATVAVVGLGASQRFSFWSFTIFGLFEHRSHKIDPQWIIDRQSKALHTLFWRQLCLIKEESPCTILYLAEMSVLICTCYVLHQLLYLMVGVNVFQSISLYILFSDGT